MKNELESLLLIAPLLTDDRQHELILAVSADRADRAALAIHRALVELDAAYVEEPSRDVKVTITALTKALRAGRHLALNAAAAFSGGSAGGRYTEEEREMVRALICPHGRSETAFRVARSQRVM